MSGPGSVQHFFAWTGTEPIFNFFIQPGPGLDIAWTISGPNPGPVQAQAKIQSGPHIFTISWTLDR